MMKRLLDFLWLAALIAFAFAIPPTFHGDEAMQISMSRDYVTAVLDGDLAALRTEPPYSPDSDAQLRLINGSVNRYAIGLSWQLAGLTEDDLPPRPGWDWGLDYDTNVSTGHMPLPALLAAARLPSTILLAVSIAAMFGIGWLMSAVRLRRPLAYFVSALYALNPIVLLNGRRALQEGAMLGFGLLAVLIAAYISQRRARLSVHDLNIAAPADSFAVEHNIGMKRTGSLPSLKSDDQRSRGRGWGDLFLWLALILASALTLASKHSGIVFVLGAFGWIFAAELTHFRGRAWALTTAKLIGAGLASIALFVALAPALWSNPVARIGDLLAERAWLLDLQTSVDPLAPLTLGQRIEQIVVQPFLTPAQHFEVAFWATFPAVTNDVARYMASPFSGLQFGIVLGGLLTALAGVGIVAALRSIRQPHCAGLLVWLLVVIASLIANPLPWQRYYLPLIPVATLLVGVGVDWIARRFVRKREQAPGSAALSHAAPQNP